MTILGLIFKNKSADDSNFTDIALGKLLILFGIVQQF